MMMMMKNRTVSAPDGAEQTDPKDTLAAAAPAAVQRVQTLGTLLGESAARNIGNGAASAAVLPLAVRVDTWYELIEMQGAIATRFQELQQGWLRGWNTWAREYGQLRRANTMSELLEQQFNLAAQYGAMFKNQAADVMNLQESIEVNYGYWVSQKTRHMGAPD
jgi:hypothetical protein